MHFLLMDLSSVVLLIAQSPRHVKIFLFSEDVCYRVELSRYPHWQSLTLPPGKCADTRVYPPKEGYKDTRIPS